MLLKEGYDVSTARDRSGALAISRSNYVDLVIAEAALTNGEEMMRAVRGNHLLVKTVAIVDGLSPDALRAADLLGAQAVLTKPLATANVLPRVRALLERRLAVY